jgi:hypothetical protein
MRMRSRLSNSVITAVAAYVFAASAALGAEPSVDASIEPSQIDLGDSARLTYFTAGSGTLSVPLPVVAGLEFRVVGQSRQIQFINGRAIESTSTMVRVTPEVVGIFSIPGPTPKSPPLVLRVNPGNAGGSSSSPYGAGLSGLTGASPGGAIANGIRLTPDGSAFVRLETPKHEIYVGESVPVEIQVGTRDGFAINNALPKFNSGDFTLNNLSFQPERTSRLIDGKRFTVFTWHSVLAAVKPGTYSLNFSAPITVRMRTQPRGDSMLDDLLGDPFLQNIFGATVQKNITVTSPEAPFTVLPLPTEGKPPDFGGAVGTFKISTDVSSATNTAGDPLTLRMHVNGTGNFDRVESTMLGADGQWKTYAPKSTFNRADPAGYRGEKVFEQPLIATQPGTRTIPPLNFSFFDPGTRRYETARSAPLIVSVSPAVEGPGNEPPPLASATGAPADESHGGLRPDHAAGKPRVDSLIPLYFQPRFLGAPSVLALLFGAGWVELRRRERRANDGQGARDRARLQITQLFLQQMAAAAAVGDAAVFFNSARSALSQSLSARWRIEPEQVTLAEVKTRLEGGDRDDVGEIFSLSDEANYSGADLKATDFERWTDIVRRQLASEPQLASECQLASEHPLARETDS